ncbi:hypothetical protein [Sporosarcina cyprini]|uniref:hypothetical protein n=1 Tax=Sporosarcina cyprini TaxID=2910523 RepID=UPI001EDF2093|nr:hypothetical protein [Sporosarcina cyprini]MCG3089819.1 hypothetical protein [Sporosarcina cyprini]
MEKGKSEIMAVSFQDIIGNFDFTDSVVTEVRWSDNLMDLIVNVDYYWDIQDGHDTTRILKIIFEGCQKVDFQISGEIPLCLDSVNKESLFTIVLFKELTGSSGEQQHLGIFTADYSKPWLSVVCTNVKLKE